MRRSLIALAVVSVQFLATACSDVLPTDPPDVQEIDVSASARLAKYDGRTYRVTTYIQGKDESTRRVYRTDEFRLSYDVARNRLDFHRPGTVVGATAMMREPTDTFTVEYPVMWDEEMETGMGDLWTQSVSATPVPDTTIGVTQVGLYRYAVPQSQQGDSGWFGYNINRDGVVKNAVLEVSTGITTYTDLTHDSNGDLTGITVMAIINNDAAFVVEVQEWDLSFDQFDGSSQLNADSLPVDCGEAVLLAGQKAITTGFKVGIAAFAVRGAVVAVPAAVVTSAAGAYVAPAYRVLGKKAWGLISSAAVGLWEDAVELYERGKTVVQTCF